MQIYTYENSGRADACRRWLEDRCEHIDTAVVLLPIPSLRGGVACFPPEALEHGGAIYVGYGIGAQTMKKLARGGTILLDCATDEEFLSENAALTALGAVGIILSTSKRAPSELSVGVVGFGRIGSRLVRLLLSLGATVRVYTGSERARLELGECGVDTEESRGDADLTGIDLLVNTAPFPIFLGRREIESGELRVMELASGENFSAKVEKYPSLPAKCFPVSAGEAWARSIMRLMEKEGCL
ncbi:MAG: hypothetical protein IJX38_05595 [Clostridia bacterium]|nr:hypothetical protein [Clostridia bacterium]